MATSFSFSSQPIDYRQSPTAGQLERDVVVGWIRPQQNLVHRPLSSNSPSSRYTPYPQPQPRASPHPPLTTSRPLDINPSILKSNSRSPTRPLFIQNQIQIGLQTSPGSRERNRLRSWTPPAPPLIPLGSYRTSQGSLTRPTSRLHAQPQNQYQSQAHACTETHSQLHSQTRMQPRPRAHNDTPSQPCPHAPGRSQPQPHQHVQKQTQAQGRPTVTFSRSPENTALTPPPTASWFPVDQTASSAPTVSMNATSSSATPTTSSTLTASFTPINSSAPSSSEPHPGSGSQRVPQVGQTVPTQSSFLCVFQYKTERVQAIGADDLATTLQSLPCIFPALAAYQPEEVTLNGIVPQIQARSPAISPTIASGSASTIMPAPTTTTTTETTTKTPMPPSTSRSLCFRMTPGLYAELRKAHRSVYSDPSDENRTQKDPPMPQQQQQGQPRHEGAMKAIPWFIVVTSEQVSGTEKRRETAGLEGEGGSGNGRTGMGKGTEMQLHPGIRGSGKGGKAAKEPRQNEDGKKGSKDGSKKGTGFTGELDRVAEREQHKEHRSSATSPSFRPRDQSRPPSSSKLRTSMPAEPDRTSAEEPSVQSQPQPTPMAIDSDNHDQEEEDSLDLVPPKGYTDREEALEALRGLSLLWKKSPRAEVVPLGGDEAGEDTQRKVDSRSRDIEEGKVMEARIGKEIEVEPEAEVGEGNGMAIDEQLETESQAASGEVRRSQTPTPSVPSLAVEPVVKQETKTPPATPLKCMTIDQITPPQPPVLYRVNTKNTIILTATTVKETTSADPFTIDAHLRELVNPAPAFHMKPNFKPKKREKKKAPEQPLAVVLPMSDRTNLLYRPMIRMSKSEKRLQASLQAAFGEKGLVQEAARE